MWLHGGEYLDTVEAARAECGGGLALAATGQAWTQLIADDHLAEVAFFRDRWDIGDQLDPLGPEPSERNSAHDVATVEHLDAALTRRRDIVNDVVGRIEHAPAWAHSLLGRSAWAPKVGAAQRERRGIAQAAVYRFDVRGDGLGPGVSPPTNWPVAPTHGHLLLAGGAR